MVGRLVEGAKDVVKKFPRVANLLRRARDARLATLRTKPTPYGFVFAGPVGMMDGTFEPVETRLVTELLRDVDVFINVGANVGYYVCHALSQGKAVVAVEPMRANLACMYRNLQANGWTQGVEVLPIALSDSPGIVEMYGSGTGASLIAGWAGAPGTVSEVVPCSTLDAIAGRRFEGRRLLILADVEGAELSLLKGAARVLRCDPAPVWMIEINVAEHHPGGTKFNPALVETFNFFWESGYEAWTAEVAPRRVNASEVEVAAKTHRDTLGVHNFIFRKVR
jgi:FkbM family methyltransferase